MRHLILTFLATAATLGGLIAALTALHLWSWRRRRDESS